MSVLDKILNAIKLNDDYDEYDEDIDFDDEDDFVDDDDDFFDSIDDGEIDDRPKKKFFEKFAKKKEATDLKDDDFEDEIKFETKTTQKSTPKTTIKAEKITKQNTSSKIMPIRSGKRTASQSVSMEVCVIKPTSMEETREIADTLLDNSTVILNLEGIDMELAQRIIDFTSGACYSLGGTLQKVSSYIFVLGPCNVDITGDLQNILGGTTPSARAGY